MKEVFKNIFANIKAIAEKPIETKDFVKTDDIKDFVKADAIKGFVTEEYIVTSITEAYQEVFPVKSEKTAETQDHEK